MQTQSASSLVGILAQSLGADMVQLQQFLGAQWGAGQVRPRSQYHLLAALTAAHTEGIGGTLHHTIPSKLADYHDFLWTPGECEVVQRLSV